MLPWVFVVLAIATRTTWSAAVFVVSIIRLAVPIFIPCIKNCASATMYSTSCLLPSIVTC